MGQHTGWYAWGLMTVAVVGVVTAAWARQKAHVHGVLRLNIVVGGTQATVELLAPAESIYGFEHQARTPAEREKRDAALARLQDKISAMVLFEAERGCRFTVTRVAVVTEGAHEHSQGKEGAHKASGEHSEVHAEFAVRCEKPLAGSQVRFGFSKIFPAITTVHVQALSEAGQIGLEVKRDRGSLRL